MERNDEVLSLFEYGNLSDRDNDSWSYGPGKFEGEPIWTEYFYHLSMTTGEELSFFDDTGSGVFATLLSVDENDTRLFPELSDTKAILLIETEQGFVYIEHLETDGEISRAYERFMD